MKASVFISWLLYCLANAWGYIWGKCGILWTQKRQDDLTAKYNANPSGMSNYKMAVLYGMRWIGHKVADCANLLRWAAKQSGDDGVHSGSNLIWDCDLKVKGALKDGKRTDGQPLKPGTFVFTGSSYDDHPHVGVYIGNGKVIEDAETKTGVIMSDITAKTSKGADKWSWWGERKGMIFDVKEGETILPAEDTSLPPQNDPVEPPVSKDDKTDYPTLRRGDKGQKVRELQTLLLNHGYALPKYGADGDFGAETEKAVKAFQRDWGLKEDGVAGPKTWEKLLTAPDKPKHYQVTITGLSEGEADDLVNKYPGAIKKEMVS